MLTFLSPSPGDEVLSAVLLYLKAFRTGVQNSEDARFSQSGLAYLL